MDERTRESQIADRNYSEYIRYRDSGAHREYAQRAKRNNDFYLGKQWNEKDEADLENGGRPALTINLCLNKVNTVAGEQISKRVDVNFQPRGNGATEEVAKDLNSLFEVTLDESQYEWLETEMFMDGIIEERGFIDLRLDFSTHVAGEARIRNADNRDVLIDPDARAYDPDTWAGIIETRLYSLDDIEAEYGSEVRTRLESIAENGTHYHNDSITWQQDTTFGGQNRSETSAPIHDADRRRIKNIRVISRQYYRMYKWWHFIDPASGDMKCAPIHWSEEKIKEFAAKNELILTQRMAKLVRWTVTADHVVIHDDWSPYRHFTLIPYFCYFRRGKSSSMMTNLISPQENLNKLSSQILHVVNSVANSGWIVEEDSLVDMTPEELEERGSQTGLVVTYQRGSNPPEKINPNTIPTGLDRMKQDAAAQMDDISGVDDVLSGTASAEFSGKALGHQEARGIRKLLLPLDNLRRTRWILARNLRDLIKDHYTEQRVIYMTDKAQPEGTNRHAYVINQRDETGRIINDITLGDYGIVVGTRPARDTYNDHQLSEMLEFRDRGVAIPDHWMVRYSSIDNKAELEQLLAKAAGFGEMSPEEQQMAQLSMELEMLELQGNIEKLEAEIRELDSRAELNEARAEDLRMGDQGQVGATKRMELEARLNEKRQELSVRERIAALAREGKDNEVESKSMTELAKAQISQQQKQQQTTTSGAKQ